MPDVRVRIEDSVKTISDKIAELGGELGPPASVDEVAELEARLGFSLPKGLLELLMSHNGSTRDKDDALWRFWPCAEITTHREYRGEADFTPDNNDLRALDPSASRVLLAGQNLILFADTLIDAPTYGVFHSPGHQWHGAVFDTSNGYLSARNWDEWAAAFVDRGEDGLLFPETLNEPEQDTAMS